MSVDVQRGVSDWRLLRTSTGSADADWLANLTDPGDALTKPISHARTRDLGVPTKVAVVVVALDAAEDPLGHTGTVDLQAIEMLRRDPDSEIPIGRAAETGVNVGDVQTFELNGARRFTVRITAPTSLDANMDSLEVWYRIERG